MTTPLAEVRREAFASQQRFPLDPSAARVNASVLRSSAHAIAALVMLGVASTETGQRAHGVSLVVLAVLTVVFIVDHLDAARRIRDGSMFVPSAWPRRLVAFVVPMLYTASFGAPSRYLAAPTWAFYAMGGVARGLGGSRIDAASVATVFACALGLHLATATVSAASIAAALAVATLACLTHVLGERMVLRALEVEQQLETADALASAAQEEAQHQAVAMSLHDGLSGLVFGLRAKLESLTDLEPLRPEVASVCERAREALAPLSAHRMLEPALRDLERTYGVPLSIRADALDGLRPLEASDLTFSALELTANTLRHGKPSKVLVEVTTGAERCVRVTAFDAGPLASSVPGRGSRHLELRARSWGGSAERFTEGAAVVSVIRWPSPERRAGPGWLSLAIPASASLLAWLVVVGDAPLESFGFVVVGVVLSATVVALGTLALRSNVAQVKATMLRREQRLSELLSTAGQPFEGVLVELRRASDSGDLSRLRTTFATFSTTLQEVLRRLEERADENREGP